MVGAPTNSTLAYSLWWQGRSWRWGVYDLEGEVVATGGADTRGDAEAAISAAYAASAKSFAEA
jgi:hypothetical protein